MNDNALAVLTHCGKLLEVILKDYAEERINPNVFMGYAVNDDVAVVVSSQDEQLICETVNMDTKGWGDEVQFLESDEELEN